MPRSIFLGRPWPQPGEPLFTNEDTAYALALAEEERDTCPKCGMQKAWCRDPAHQFAFEPVEDVCWPTWRLQQFYRGEKWNSKHDDTKAATSIAVRFRDTFDPSVDAGLALAEGDEGDHYQRQEQ